MWSRGRLLGLAVLCLAAVLALSACGGGSDTTSGGGGTETSEAETGGGTGEESAQIVPFKSVEEGAATSYPEPKSGNFKLAYMNPAAGNEFLKTLGTSMKLETEKLGGTYSEVAAK